MDSLETKQAATRPKLSRLDRRSPCRGRRLTATFRVRPRSLKCSTARERIGLLYWRHIAEAFLTTERNKTTICWFLESSLGSY